MGRTKGSKNKIKKNNDEATVEKKAIKLVITKDKAYRQSILESKFANSSYCSTCRMKLAECVCG